MEKLAWFCLPNDLKAYFTPYISPEDESSAFKWIPIDQLEETKRYLKLLGKFRIVYRGRRDRVPNQDWTYKRDAVAFTVYPK